VELLSPTATKNDLRVLCCCGFGLVIPFVDAEAVAFNHTVIEQGHSEIQAGNSASNFMNRFVLSLFDWSAC